MFYSKEEKELLGRYFRYSREKQGIKLNDVIKTGICDYKTYKGIEEGKVIKSDEIYEDLIKFYHLKIDNIDILIDVLKDKIDSLYDAVEWYNNTKIQLIIKDIRKSINDYKDENIFKQLMYSIMLIEKYYVLSNDLNEDEINNGIKFIGLWNNGLSSILLEVCEISNKNGILDNELFDEMRKFLFRNDRITKYRKACDSVLNANYVEAIDIYRELLVYYKNVSNDLRILDNLMSLFNIYRDIDKEKSKECYDEITKIMNNTVSIPDGKKSIIYYNFGMYFYLKHDFVQALKNMENVYKIKKNMKSLLFVCACKSRLNIPYEIDIKLDDNHALFKYLNYFRMKCNSDSIVLEDYILNTVMKSLKYEKYEEPLWSMFRYELKELINNTKRYKSLYIFEEKFQKVTKNCD